jgi:hypothetical protein
VKGIEFFTRKPELAAKIPDRAKFLATPQPPFILTDARLLFTSVCVGAVLGGGRRVRASPALTLP